MKRTRFFPTDSHEKLKCPGFTAEKTEKMAEYGSKTAENGSKMAENGQNFPFSCILTRNSGLKTDIVTFDGEKKWPSVVANFFIYNSNFLKSKIIFI
jgi:hypothetical protein